MSLEPATGNASVVSDGEVVPTPATTLGSHMAWRTSLGSCLPNPATGSGYQVTPRDRPRATGNEHVVRDGGRLCEVLNGQKWSGAFLRGSEVARNGLAGSSLLACARFNPKCGNWCARPARRPRAYSVLKLFRFQGFRSLRL